MRHTWFIGLSTICVFGLISLTGFAQVPKSQAAKPGALDGIVVSAKGNHVSGAQILWQAADGGTPHVLHTDSQGHFSVPRLKSGLYDVRASRGQIQSEWTHNVLVRPGEPTTITLRLVTTAPATPVQAK